MSTLDGADVSALDDAAVAAFAARLHAAARTQGSIEPITTTVPGLNVASAFGSTYNVPPPASVAVSTVGGMPWRLESVVVCRYRNQRSPTSSISICALSRREKGKPPLTCAVYAPW